MKLVKEEVEFDVFFTNADDTDNEGWCSAYTTVEDAQAYAKRYMLDNTQYVKATILRRSVSEVAYVERRPFSFKSLKA